ncbi:hypothetical protein EV401DRAFT_1127926 [Pisolithus croceorrhizus]|nr:hypothetical protein EV401DRAFT_1127926 [Pisolithus croceorrhizus]
MLLRRCKLTISYLMQPSPFENRAELPHHQIDTHLQPSIASLFVPPRESVDEFSSYKLIKRHGHPGLFRFCPHRGFGVRYVIWHNSSTGTYMYYMHNLGDALAIKFLVATVWILDTLQVSFMCHALCFYLITNYGVPSSLDYAVWSLPVSILMNVLTVFAFQCFFARQIYYLCAPRMKWWITALIMIFILTQLGFGIETVVLGFFSPSPSVATQTTSYGVTPFAAIIALADVLITISLCILFYGKGSVSAYPSTKRLLNTLVVYTVNRCVLNLLVAIAVLVMSVEDKTTWLLGWTFVVGKCQFPCLSNDRRDNPVYHRIIYANSLLASLNSREHLRSQGADTLSDLRLSLHFANPPKLPEGIESSKNGEGHFDIPEMAVMDISADAAFDKTTTLRREGEV